MPPRRKKAAAPNAVVGDRIEALPLEIRERVIANIKADPIAMRGLASTNHLWRDRLAPKLYEPYKELQLPELTDSQVSMSRLARLVQAAPAFVKYVDKVSVAMPSARHRAALAMIHTPERHKTDLDAWARQAALLSQDWPRDTELDILLVSPNGAELNRAVLLGLAGRHLPLSICLRSLHTYADLDMPSFNLAFSYTAVTILRLERCCIKSAAFVDHIAELPDLQVLVLDVVYENIEAFTDKNLIVPKLRYFSFRSNNVADHALANAVITRSASTLRGLCIPHANAGRWPHLTALAMATELDILILPNGAVNRPELLRVLRSCHAEIVWAKSVGRAQLETFREEFGSVLRQHASFWPRLSHVSYGSGVVQGQRSFGSLPGRRITEGDTPWHKYPADFAPFDELNRSTFKVSSCFLA